ncbi:MAG: histidine-type phosphatase [Terracidiphilus sp.]
MKKPGGDRLIRFLIAGTLLIPLAVVFPLDAQSTAQDAGHTNGKARLKLVVILSRHGVRPPTWTQERLNAYSALPWPNWTVPPGNLTPHGYELMKRFGSFERASYAEAGLFVAKGCSDAAATYVWADTDQRTMESGRALAEGMFPGCPPMVHSLAAGEHDPLFHPRAHGLKAASALPVKNEHETTAMQLPDKDQSELLAEMQHVLMGCSPRKSCTPVQAPEILLLGDSTNATGGISDHPVEIRGPLGQASSFAEDFLLEYVEGMPSSQVGWGNVDAAQLRRFITLHSDYSDLTHRTPESARAEASNLLFHIARTLDQGAEGHSVEDALGPAGSKMVLLVGHDTNISGVAALLGLDWSLDGRRDDTPPGTELAFGLWQNENGAYTVRVTVSMQTLRQMREMRKLTSAAPPAQEELMLKGCRAETHACRLEDFMRFVDGAIDRGSVSTARSN